MQIKYDASAGELTVMLAGEIDHHSAGMLRAEVDAAVYANTPKNLILDFSRVSFMDSSGIAVVLRLRKKAGETGGRLWLEDPAPQPLRVLTASGIGRLVKIEKRKGSENK